MNEYLAQIERGKAILRAKRINFSIFKKELSLLLEGANKLLEDEWVEHYNTYASCVGRTGFESIRHWAKDFYQEFNKKEHRIWLRR